uniref:LAG1_DNAbind domain-containing protein n=1 Tax=Rhabditophanes sp. KR3021 TaxID=114890 RepID=A0AC35TLW5_9BILA
MEYLLNPHLSTEYPTPDQVENFIVNKSRMECCVTIKCPKLAIKSYKEGYRYLNPPPIIEFGNSSGWSFYKYHVNTTYSKCLKEFDDNNIICNDYPLIEESSDIGIVSTVEGNINFAKITNKFNGITMTIPLKNIYFDSRQDYKNVFISSRILTTSGITLGTFDSGSIDVVSKFCHSKKETSKNFIDNTFIKSGDQVSLFLKDKKKLTSNFVNCNEDVFLGSPTNYKCFDIFVIDENRMGGDTTELLLSNSNLYYGCVVSIRSINPDIQLPLLRIMKPKNQIVTLKDQYTHQENVCQMSQVCFMIVDASEYYLSLQGPKLTNKIGNRMSNYKVEVDHTCIFTLAGISERIYQFGFTTGIPNASVTPCPFVLNHCVNVCDDITKFDLIGENFTTNLTAWVRRMEIKTILKTETVLTLLFNASQIDKIKEAYRYDNADVYIYLVRNDGIIYSTSIEAIFD